MRINICMLLGLQYDPKMRIAPQIGIASYITKFGHDVTWVLSSGELQEVLETTFNNICVYGTPYRYGKGIFKVYNKILYGFKRMRFLFEIFKNGRYNMIFVREGIFDGLLAIYIKNRYNIPFVFEIANPIEQSWKTRRINYPRHKCFWYLVSKIEAYLTMYILRNADLVLPTTNWMLEDFVKKRVERSKMMSFPNGIDLSRFSNADGGVIRARYGLEDSKVVIYVGTMQKERYLDVLIHAFSKVRENKENVKLLMVGDGNDKSILEKLAKDLGIDADVIFTSYVYSHEVPNFIAAADVGVSPIPPLSFYNVSSPIKMLEYMAIGKPVVANEEIPEQKEVIEESGGGVLVQFEEESFARGIVELLDNPERAREMGRRGRKWVVRNRSYEVLARRLEKKYSELVNTYKQGGK